MGKLSCINNSGHVVISDGATVTLTCSSNGIYTNGNLKICGSSTVYVTTKGVGLQGGTGLSITEGSTVTAISANDNGIYCMRGVIEISGESMVTAEGKGQYPGGCQGGEGCYLV